MKPQSAQKKQVGFGGGEKGQRHQQKYTREDGRTLTSGKGWFPLNYGGQIKKSCRQLGRRRLGKRGQRDPLRPQSGKRNTLQEGIEWTS